jgi:periplasmic divalent cation tolerance protein
MAKSSIALIYITNKNEAEAKNIAKALLGKKLIACANMFPIKSLYRWKGKIENSKEVVLIAKTKQQNYEKIKKVVKQLHSYSVPCIMKIDAVANEPYYKWLMGEMK